jgi:hypothetical protein
MAIPYEPADACMWIGLILFYIAALLDGRFNNNRKP